MGSKKVSAPAPRSYLDELNSSLTGQEGVQDRVLSLERRFTPQWQDVQNENQLRGMGLLQGAYGQAIPLSAKLSQDYADAMRPVYAGIGASARTAYDATLDPSVSGLLSTLGKQAGDDLSRGTALSPEEQKQSEQAARLAMAARGLTGNQAVAQEVLNNYNLGQARQNQARSFAGSVYGLGQNAALSSMNMYGTPMLNAAQNFSPTSLYGTTATLQQGLGPQLFQPESQYNAQLITANRKEQMDAQIANAQSRNAFTSGLMGMAGSLGGGFLGNAGLFTPKTTTNTQTSSGGTWITNPYGL